ncbi:hypothetical protein Vau01_047030 [Virgisporangium aurantiacum]|uniref:Uncharacterized protein n=1 Tax=Virgisporangium aurantiacum TaxID=175570 RepID=A0A8J3Z6A8_9ACTN|nr:hypothetical protein Vau01_047030 [Virgisporangium aurantiacum]
MLSQIGTLPRGVSHESVGNGVRDLPDLFGRLPALAALSVV